MSESLKSPVVLGAGPVARAVVATLLECGAEPTMVTRSASTAPGARSMVGDVSDVNDARGVISGASVVFQCAQPPYHRWVQEFPALQRTVLEACAAAGAPLVAAENVYGYGDVAGARFADTEMKPDSDKGAVRTKMWGELLRAHHGGVVATAAVRASDFFGPGVVGSVYGSRYFDAIAKGRRAEVLGSPNARHSITYVPDFGRALVAVAADPTAWGRAWHAPTADAITQAQIVEIAAHAVGRPSRLRARSHLATSTVRQHPPIVFREPSLSVPRSASGSVVSDAHQRGSTMSALFEALDRQVTPMGEISLRRRLQLTLDLDVYGRLLRPSRQRLRRPRRCVHEPLHARRVNQLRLRRSAQPRRPALIDRRTPDTRTISPRRAKKPRRSGGSPCRIGGGGRI